MTAPSTDPVVRLHRAEADAAAARQRLMDTVAQLQARLDPRTLVDKAKTRATDAVHSATETGTALGHDAADTVRANPGAVVGVVGALVLFLARNRIASLFHSSAPRPVAQQHANPMSEGSNHA